jgi:hypothetical protein
MKKSVEKKVVQSKPFKKPETIESKKDVEMRNPKPYKNTAN